MKSIKYLGIWMDHSIAHIIELKNDIVVTNIIESETDQSEKQHLGKDEKLRQNIDQKQLKDYFTRISNVIIDYKEVLLFGPTNAKTELLNLLKADRHFEEIKIDVKNADKLTDNQLEAFVKEHFEIRL